MVLPGPYSLMAMFQGVEKETLRRLFASQDVDVGQQDVENVVLTLEPLVEISGRARAEGPGTVRWGEINLSLQPEPHYFPSGMAKMKPDGSFSLSAAPGRYLVRAMSLPDDCYIKSVRIGDRIVNDDRLTIGAGGAISDLEVLVSTNGGRVDGRLLDDNDKPVSGARVVLAPEASRRSRTELYRVVNTDSRGGFSVRGVVPGNYKLFAWDELQGMAYQDPEFLKKYESRGKPLRIAEGAKITADLKVIIAEVVQ